ncbi:hypothetical protein AVEN_223725-1 [Araneus ventricosus]|uniref:Uncharacterized protein n=1 Tax=Araneus ventricosus TaxID=182803 RepID=A0A4Y2UNH4_ARAVE|nr:hypothetical protein AVEN_223725-1 [Araneus ventricosus]
MNFFSNVLDSIPVVGHVKGVIHYAAGDTDGGNRAMYQASRTSAVVTGSVVGGVLGGPAGAVGGAVYAGSMTDIVVSAATKKPQGIVQHCENVADDIKQGKNPTVSILTTTVHVGLDAVGGLGMGGISNATAKSVGSEVAANVGKGMIEKSVKISAEEAAKFTVRKASETVAKKTVETVIKKTAEKVVSETAEIVAVQAFTAIAYTAERAALEAIEQKQAQAKERKTEREATRNENNSRGRKQSGTGSGSNQPPKGNRDGSETRRCNNSKEFLDFLELLKEILDSNCNESFGKIIFDILKNLKPGQINYLMKLIKDLNHLGTTKIVLENVIKIFVSNRQIEFNFTNFLSFMEFVKTYVNNTIEDLSVSSLGTGESSLNVPNEQRRTSLIEAIKKIPDLLKKMVDTFFKIKAEIETEVANGAVIPDFRDIFSAVYHYFKHRIVPGDGIFSVKEYYDWIRRLLQRVRALPDYSDLERGRIPKNEIVYEMYVAVFGRRIRIIIKKYEGAIVLSSCYVVIKIYLDDEEGYIFVNGQRLE